MKDEMPISRGPLKIPDTERNMTKSHRFTTVIATSPTPYLPAIYHIQETIESLAFVPELAASPILIVFDAPRKADPAQAMAYADYRANVLHFCAPWSNIQLLQLETWGHLSGVMERALDHVRTPFLFAQQHDLPLIRSFDLDGVVSALSNDDLVKHVRLNRRRNRAICWDRTPLFSKYDNPYVSLTRTGCWSDNSHLTTAEYYRSIVIPAVRGRRSPIERILTRELALPVGPSLLAAHRRLGTFIYGAPGDPPVTRHTDARGARGLSKHILESARKLEL